MLSGVLVASRRIFGSSFGVFVGPLGVMSPVSCVAGGSVDGLGSCSLLLAALRLGYVI